MEQQRPHPQSESHRIHSPTTYAVILLAVFVAMYLTVGAIVHLFGAPADAQVAATQVQVAPTVPQQPADADRAISREGHDDARAD